MKSVLECFLNLYQSYTEVYRPWTPIKTTDFIRNEVFYHLPYHIQKFVDIPLLNAFDELSKEKKL